MREIKFRAWNKKLKCWGGDIAIRKNGVHTVSMLSDHVTARGDSYEIMQYTGLKDKNGKEIYEGDICQDVLNEKWQGKVYFEEACFYFGWRNIIEPLCEVSDQIEVIGNIYENKELLAPTPVVKELK